MLQGALYAKLHSHLPLGASIELCFAATDTSVYTNPQVTLGPITLEEGFIDPNTGLVSAPQQSDIALTLSKKQIDFFARDTVYSGLRVTLPGTGNQTVRLLATDYIDVKAYAKFQLHVNDALTSNEGK